MIKSGASANFVPSATRDLDAEKSVALSAILQILPSSLLIPQGEASVQHILLLRTLEFQASLVADLVYSRRFDDQAIWASCAGSFLVPWLSNGSVEAPLFAEKLRVHFKTLDEEKNSSVNGVHETEEVLCNTEFSLAYGTLLLLSHTTLRLIRGRRYGILGTNGSGKSTLMRQLRDGKVENFPPQDQLRCVMVEHSLQGEDTSLSVIDFIASGLSNPSGIIVPRYSLRPNRQGLGYGCTFKNPGSAS